MVNGEFWLIVRALLCGFLCCSLAVARVFWVVAIMFLGDTYGILHHLNFIIMGADCNWSVF